MDIQLLIPAIRIILGLLFVLASLFKFPDMKGFRTAVAAYGILPKPLITPLAYALPIIEIVIGILLLFNIYVLYAAIAGLFMMIIADFFVGYALYTKKKMDDCGCYGIAVKIPISWKKLAENLFWTALFILLIVFYL